MKKNFTHAITMMISIFISSLCNAGVCQSPANHCLELACEVEAVHDRSVQTSPVQSVTVFTPKAPYNNVTIIITAPAKVCVDQPFVIDYAIQVTKFTHISFWADLLPDADQGVPVTILDISNATIGDLNADDETIAHQGGKGTWVFPKGLPGNSVQHLVITAKATNAGKIKFTSLLATNPPSYIETAGTLVSCTVPTVNPATIYGVKNKPVTVYALDNVVADSEVSIVNVCQASYGTIVLNDDYTITYTPYPYFYGNDSFAYTVQDSARNTASGSVSLVIEYAPSPAVLKN